jgi:O-antigen/teichoic acid export membrane protein
MKASESSFKPALMLMSGRLAAFTVTFFSGPLLARVFTQPEFGTYKQFLLVAGTLFTLGQFGFSECLYYFLPAKPESAGRYAFNSLLMLGSIGVLCASLLTLNSVRIADWMKNPELSAFLFLAGIYLVFNLMGTVLETTLICRKKFRWATISYVLSDVLRVAFLLIPAIITRSLEWAFIGSITFFMIRVGTMATLFRKEFGSEFRFDARLLREQFIYALPYSAYVTLFTIQSNYHQYAVSYHFDAATFAIYSVGCLQIPLVDFMATPASNVMMVQMGERLREGRMQPLRAIWHDTTRKLAFVFFPLVGLLMVNAAPLITLLYTKSYAASIPIFMIWSLSILAAAFQTDGVLRVFADNRWLMFTNFVRLGVVVALMGSFLNVFQLKGAVYVTLTSIVIAKVFMLGRIKTRLEATLPQLLPWKAVGSVLLVAMLAAVPPLVLNAKVALPVFLLLPLSGMAYMITYTMLVLTFGLLTEGEKASLKRSLYVWNRRARESRTEVGI